MVGTAVANNAARTDAQSSNCHPACIACRPRDAGGLGLQFRVEADGSVVAEFPCDQGYQGYPDRLHGGVVATLLDAAMTHCLFGQGVQGYTGRLNIQFRHPVQVECVATIRARLERANPPLYILEAEICQAGEVRARGQAKFFGEPIGPASAD